MRGLAPVSFAAFVRDFRSSFFFFDLASSKGGGPGILYIGHLLVI